MEVPIFEDCLNLIEQFTDNNNPRFESFCTQWKSIMFQHMYSAQTSVVEILQTTKTMLHLAKRIVCAKDDVGKVVAQTQDDGRQLLRRIGGMYLMYAIYFNQPTKQYVKVSVSPETWQDISTFIDTLPTEPHTDEVRYIFWRLYQSDAFRFTALDYEVGLEDLVDYDRLYDLHKGKNVELVRVKLKVKLHALPETEKVLPEMTELEDEYNNIKQSLAVAQTLPPTDIFHDIQDVIKNINDVLDDKRNSSSKSNKESINVKRKDLKRKAAGIVDNNLDNEKSNDDSDSDELTSQGPTKKTFGRMSSRNMITETLPDHIMDDLKNSSSEEEDEENSGENESEGEEQQEDSESDEVDSKNSILPTQQEDSESDEVDSKMSILPN